MSTFLCSLRPGPAASSWIGCSMRESDSRRFGMRHRFSEEGLHDLQDLGPSARGLVRHVGRGGGSAESVLRSQGTLGPAKLSRYRARGIRMSTFLCSLRPGPAASSWIGCSMRESDSRRFGMRHRFSEEGLHDLQDLGPSARGLVRHVGRGGAPRNRSCARRERWGRLSFRSIARGGSGCRRSYARSGPIPLPLRGWGFDERI